MERSRKDPTVWYLTWSIIYEFLRVTTHSRIYRHPWTASKAWAFVLALLDSPSLGLLQRTARHPEVVRGIIDTMPRLRGNLMHDLQVAALMREHGIVRIYTRDTDFHRFKFLQPVDPAA